MDAGLVNHYEKKQLEAARLSKCDSEEKEGVQLGYFKLATLFFNLYLSHWAWSFGHQKLIRYVPILLSKLPV